MSVTVDATRMLLARHPFSDWLPYRGYDKDGFFLMEDGGIGFIFKCQPLVGAGEDTVKMLRSIYEMDLEANSTIQIAMHSSFNINAVLDQYVSYRSENTIFKQMALRKREMFLSSSSLVKSFNYRARNFDVYVSVKLAGDVTPDGIAKAMKKAYDTRNGVEQTLKIIGLHPEPVDAAGLLTLLYEVLNPGHDPYLSPVSYDSSIPLNRQAVWADNIIRLHNDHFELDGYKVKALSVKQYPDSFSLWNIADLTGDSFQNLRQVMQPFWFVLNARYLDYESARSKFNVRHAFVTNQALGPLVKLIPMLSLKKGHFDKFSMALNQGEKPVSVCMNIFLYGRTEDDVTKAVKGMQIIFRSRNFILQEDNFIGLGAFKFSLPLAFSMDPKVHKDMKRNKTIRSVNAVNLSPVVSDPKGTGTPTLLFTSRRGQIMPFDLFDNTQGNYNLAIAAASGGGKSFFTNEIICSYLGRGGRVWMIDAGRSYVKLNEQLKGEYIEFKKGENKWCLNPFSKIVEMDDEELAMLKALFAQMASPTKPLDDLQMSWIEKAIKDVYDAEGKNGTPTSVARKLKGERDMRVQDLGDMLFPYTSDGGFGRMFNGVNNMEFDNPFVVLELDGLDSRLDLRSVILLQLVMNINADMYLKCPKSMRKLLMLDEAWDLLSQGGNMAAFFEKGARRVRKYGGSLTTITQGIDDYYEKMGQTGKAVLNNSDHIALLRQKPESLQALKQSGRLILDDHTFDMLKSVHTSSGEYSEIFFYAPSFVGIGRLIVDRFSYWLYTTKPDDLQVINDYIAAGFSLEQAINEIVDKEKGLPRRRKNDVRVEAGAS